MRILLITQYFWPENFRINEMSRELENRGHTVTVLTGLPNYPSGKIFPGYSYFGHLKDDYHGIEVLRFPHLPRGDRGFIGMGANFATFAAMGSVLAPWLLRGRDFDVIFVYMPSPVTVGFPAVVMRHLRKIPIVFWVHDMWPECITSAGGIKSPFILKSVDKMVRYLYSRFDTLLVAFKGFMSHAVAHGVDPSRVIYYPQSTEPCFVPVSVPEDAPERTVWPEGFTILFAGNVGVSQDFPTILKAAEYTKDYGDIKWVIVGSGRMDEWVGKQIKEKGLAETVITLGRHPQESMPKYFALADVMLVTLKDDPVYHATVPTKIQAYMGCGRPVLAGLGGDGARVINESGAGLAASPENPKALAEAAIKFYKMPKSEREAMGRAGHEYSAKHFNPDRLMEELEEILSDAVKRGVK